MLSSSKVDPLNRLDCLDSRYISNQVCQLSSSETAPGRDTSATQLGTGDNWLENSAFSPMALTLLKQAKIRYPGLNPLQDRKLAEWVLSQAHLQLTTNGTPDMNNFICSSAVQSGGKSLLPQLNVNPTLSDDIDNKFHPIHSAIVNGNLYDSACQNNCVSMSFNTSDQFCK